MSAAWNAWYVSGRPLQARRGGAVHRVELVPPAAVLAVDQMRPREDPERRLRVRVARVAGDRVQRGGGADRLGDDPVHPLATPPASRRCRSCRRKPSSQPSASARSNSAGGASSSQSAGRAAPRAARAAAAPTRARGPAWAERPEAVVRAVGVVVRQRPPAGAEVLRGPATHALAPRGRSAARRSAGRAPPSAARRWRRRRRGTPRPCACSRRAAVRSGSRHASSHDSRQAPSSSAQKCASITPAARSSSAAPPGRPASAALAPASRTKAWSKRGLAGHARPGAPPAVVLFRASTNAVAIARARGRRTRRSPGSPSSSPSANTWVIRVVIQSSPGGRGSGRPSSSSHAKPPGTRAPRAKPSRRSRSAPRSGRPMAARRYRITASRLSGSARA